MRIAFDLRLSLSEAESNNLAWAAYRAGLPVNEYLKSRILELAMSPAQNVVQQETVSIVEAEQPLQPSKSPSPQPVTHKPPPVTTPIPDTHRVEKKVADEPKSKKKVEQIEVPVGIENILSVAEKLAEARQNIVNELGGVHRGYAYNVKMSAWYKANGFESIHANMRSTLSKIGRAAARIRQWYAGLSEEDIKDKIPDDLRVSELYSLLDSIPQQTIPTKEPSLPPVSDEKQENIGDKEEERTLAYRQGRLQSLPVSEVIQPVVSSTSSSNGKEIINERRLPKFDNFNQLVHVIDKLNNEDLRLVRRFTDRIIKRFGGVGNNFATLTERDIAAAIRKIRGTNEVGDNPPTSQNLVRLGILSGSSGVYQFRREYIERFDDVRNWLASHNLLAAT